MFTSTFVFYAMYRPLLVFISADVEIDEKHYAVYAVCLAAEKPERLLLVTNISIPSFYISLQIIPTTVRISRSTEFTVAS